MALTSFDPYVLWPFLSLTAIPIYIFISQTVFIGHVKCYLVGYTQNGKKSEDFEDFEVRVLSSSW
jgi:hypothetical protein